jgi:hypothetical protein
MVKYEKPVLSMVEGTGEGVYMASGVGSSDANCWTVSGRSVQSWSGVYNVFEISAQHSNEVEHISSNVDYVFTFSAPITAAESEFPCTFSGNKVYVSRTLHANAYQSGDSVTFKVMVAAGDQAATELLSITNISWSCTHQTNVQGKYD